MSDQSDDDDTVEIANLRKRVLSDTKQVLAEGEKLLDELSPLNASERVWFKWFNSLINEDRKVVEKCAERGVFVTPANVSQLKAIVTSQYKNFGKN